MQIWLQKSGINVKTYTTWGDCQFDTNREDSIYAQVLRQDSTCTFIVSDNSEEMLRNQNFQKWSNLLPLQIAIGCQKIFKSFEGLQFINALGRTFFNGI